MKDLLKNITQKTDQQTSVVNCQGETVVFTHASYDKKMRKAWMSELYVKDKLRGRGFGSDVFNHLCENLFTRGIRNLHFGTEKSNHKAISFYQKLGCSFTAWSKYKFKVK